MLEKKKIFFSLSFLFVFLLGFLGGYAFFTNPFREMIDNQRWQETLESVIQFSNKGKKADFALSYKNPTKIKKKMRDITWSPPSVLTPFLGRGNRPGVYQNTTINSMQFRAETDLIVPKPLGVFRIFLTGGSTAFSSGAPSQDLTIGSLLETELKKYSHKKNLSYEVYTIAAPAWASTHERIMIENRLHEWSPNLVISLSGNNDVHWGANGQNILWFRTYEEEFVWNLLKHLYKTLGFHQWPDVVAPKNSPISPKIVAERLVRNIQLAHYALSLKKTPYIFFLQPTIGLTGKELSPHENQFYKKGLGNYFRQCYQEIDSQLKTHTSDSFYFYNLAKIFDSLSKRDQVFLDSYHFGDKGNEIIAQNMALLLKKTILKNLTSDF